MTTGADTQKNFLVVDAKTDTATIESTFDKFIERKDIAIVLINQHASYVRASEPTMPLLILRLESGCRQNTPSYRYLHRCFPYHSGNTEQRPPLRSRERQCAKEGASSLWRIRVGLYELGKTKIWSGWRIETFSALLRPSIVCSLSRSRAGWYWSRMPVSCIFETTRQVQMGKLQLVPAILGIRKHNKLRLIVVSVEQCNSIEMTTNSLPDPARAETK